jgi:DMSO/TMAO reductase YedYZ molybdopterin-dependent catalytic subunit
MKRSVLIVLLALSAISLAFFLNLRGFAASEAPKENTTDDSEWKLVVDGFVQRPLNLTLKEIVEMPRSAVNAAIYCLPDPGSSGVLVEEGNWVGVRLRLVLEKAGVSKEAVKVAFYAEDGFTTDLTVKEIMHEDILLAYEKDGDPLAKLRLVVPGKWGYKWIHSINHIELVNFDFKGTYESRGFPDDAYFTS